MKTTVLILLCFIFTVGVYKQALASHAPNGEISYKCTGTPGIFEVTLILYRKCDGSTGNICTSGCGTACSTFMNINGADPGYLGTSFGTFSLQLRSLRDADVQTSCPGLKNTCNNMGCVTAGTYYPAVERYEFAGVVNLGATSAIPAACCNISLSYQLCCRSSDIRTGGADAGFYNEAIINRCLSVSPCNSSPVFKNDPDIQVFGNNNYVGNLGAQDPDHDSLSYSFAPALSAAGTSVPYTPPFSYNKPMPWMGNADGIFPSGISCNPFNGDIMFTPPNTGGSFKGIVCVAVKQWRYINGVPTLIGTTSRDIEMTVSNAPANNPPRLITNPPDESNVNVPKTYHYVCEGEQLCFTITAKDTDFLPPTVADTTYLRWDSALASLGATFLPDYDITKRYKPDSLGGGPREDRYKFCWTPPVGTASSIPYYFTVNAADNRCPYAGELTRAFGITVMPKASAQIYQSTNSCNQKLLSYSNTTPAIPIGKAFWRIAKVPGDSTFAQGYNTYTASTTPGVFSFYTLGRYAMQLEVITNGPIGGSGCSKIYSSFIEVTTISLLDSFVITHPTCAAIPNGEIIVKAYNGVGPYQYKLNDQPYTSNDTFTNLSAGKYIIRTKDATGCERIDSVWLNNPTVITNTKIVTPPVCHNGNNGSFSIQAGGGTPPYTYSINQQPAQSDSVFNNLTPGKYRIMIKDVNACSKNDSVIVENVAELTIHYTLKQATCFDGNDGKIIVSPLTGKAPFTFSINQQPFQSDSVFTNITAGTYQLRVMDANVCVKTDSVKLENPAKVSAQYKLIPVSCFDGNNGKIIVAPKTGKQPFTYSLNQQSPQLTPVFENLQADKYTITLTDSNQCVHTDTVIISQPSVLSYVKTTTAISCHNANDGSLSIIPGGGTGPYRIELGLFSYPVPATISPIPYGVYSYRIIDSNGCFIQLTDTFENPPEIHAGTINGDSIVMPNSTHSYSVPFQQNLNYVWNVTGGTLISSSPNPPMATVQWDSVGIGFINLSAYNGICGDTTVLEVHIGSTGVNEITKAMGVKVYPNPARNILNISVKQLPEDKVIRLYDIQGRLLIQQELQLNQQLNIETLAPGLYLIKIGTWSGQVVKE